MSNVSGFSSKAWASHSSSNTAKIPSPSSTGVAGSVCSGVATGLISSGVTKTVSAAGTSLTGSSATGTTGGFAGVGGTVLVQREMDKHLSQLTLNLAFGKRFFKA